MDNFENVEQEIAHQPGNPYLKTYMIYTTEFRLVKGQTTEALNHIEHELQRLSNSTLSISTARTP